MITTLKFLTFIEREGNIHWESKYFLHLPCQQQQFVSRLILNMELYLASMCFGKMLMYFTPVHG